MADLELKDTAATLMKGSRQVRLVRAITIIRMLITTVLVVARPTAIASLPVRNPRQQAVTVMI